MFKKVSLILLLFLTAVPVFAQDPKIQWVDSVFRRLSLPEKIGQLFMIPASSYWTGDKAAATEAGVKQFFAGSLYITGGEPVGHVKMINKLQQAAKVPLLTGLAGWGLSQTIDSVMNFPKGLALGAIRDDSSVYYLGKTIASQMQMLGLQINFITRPDVYRKGLSGEAYFSDQKEIVSRKGMNLMRGLQDHGVIAVLKEPPAPKVSHDSSVHEGIQVDTSSMIGAMEFIRAGAMGLLTSNFGFTIHVKKKSFPAAVSPVFVTELLRKSIGFGGLTFTDVPALQAMTGKLKDGDIALLAFSVGNDILINPPNPSAGIKRIIKALKKDRTLEEQLNASVKKILGAKYDAGLAAKKYVDSDNLMRRLHSAEDKLFTHQMAESAVTVVRNDQQTIPIKILENRRFVSISVGTGQGEFDRYLARYAPIRKIFIASSSDTLYLSEKLSDADVVVIGVYPGARSFQKNIIPVLRRNTVNRTVIVSDFGNPDDLGDWAGIGTVIEAYSDRYLMPKIAAQIIFGGMGAKGILPVEISDSLRAGSGIETTTYDRFSYTLPEAAGLDGDVLERIKFIAQEAIDMQATPGCRVFVAKDGKVVYDKSFGWLTYEKKIPVTDETIYDLASVTKVSATLQTIMFLQEKGLIDLDKKISLYLPELKGSNKEDFIIKDILTHQAGLWPYLPFWTLTMKDSVYLPEFYSQTESPDYSFPVSKNLFANRAMKDSLWQWIIHAKIIDKPRRVPYDYRYSDMGFYIMQHLAEKLLNQPMEEFLNQNLYEPLGAYTTGYLPLRKFSENRIAPTEDDKLFRKSLLRGYVHDQGAAMQGGIAGHAGLFSTANDLAKLGQMWLQGGHYGGHRYFKPQTLELFEGKQYANSRRGLGWDRPVASDPDGTTSYYASQRTFGHTGFTGTCIWVDPEFNLVYVFLSNRVNPSMTNNKILSANIRPRIQDVIYKSLFKYCQNHN